MTRTFEGALALALLSQDPYLALERALGDELMKHVDRDGVELTALLIARARFERLMCGSMIASKLFADDPAGFSELFRRYHHAVRPTAFFPQEEAELFEDWLSSTPKDDFFFAEEARRCDRGQ